METEILGFPALSSATQSYVAEIHSNEQMVEVRAGVSEIQSGDISKHAPSFPMGHDVVRPQKPET
jgi:hypothetical protein